MLDSLTKIFSVATLGFLFLMALFNIGYFYAIGFHFIGVMDISNVVYTFGLVLIFAMLYIAVGQVVWVVSDGLAKVGSKVIWPKLGNKGKLIIAICAVVLVSVAITFLFRPTANEKLIGLTTAGTRRAPDRFSCFNGALSEMESSEKIRRNHCRYCGDYDCSRNIFAWCCCSSSTNGRRSRDIRYSYKVGNVC